MRKSDCGKLIFSHSLSTPTLIALILQHYYISQQPLQHVKVSHDNMIHSQKLARQSHRLVGEKNEKQVVENFVSLVNKIKSKRWQHYQILRFQGSKRDRKRDATGRIWVETKKK